jgi:hypothetical protein
MTTIYLVKNISDKEGKIISLADLNKLNEANAYNVRIDNKSLTGLIPEEIKLITDSNLNNKIYIQEVYNRAQGLAERALQA